MRRAPVSCAGRRFHALGAGIQVSAPTYFGAEIAGPAPCGVAPPAAAAPRAEASRSALPCSCAAAPGQLRVAPWAPLSCTGRRFHALGANICRRRGRRTGAVWGSRRRQPLRPAPRHSAPRCRAAAPRRPVSSASRSGRRFHALGADTCRRRDRRTGAELASALPRTALSAVHPSAASPRLPNLLRLPNLPRALVTAPREWRRRGSLRGRGAGPARR